MKKISDNLKSHIESNLTTLAQCYFLRRKDGVEQCLTDCGFDLLIEGSLYKSSNSFNASSIETSASMAVDNLEIEGVIDSTMLKAEDIEAGRYDYAYVEIFLINYKQPADGKLILKTGYIGEIKTKDVHFTAEIRGLSQKLNNNLGSLFSPSCRVKFGSSKCGVNAASFGQEGRVLKLHSGSSFVATGLPENINIYKNGTICFAKKSDVELEIRNIYEKTVNLMDELPFSIRAGDEFAINPGCDKQFKTCCEQFGNAINFRGEPHLPGMDEMLKTAGTMIRN